MLIRDIIRDREPYSMKATASVMEGSEFTAQQKIGAVYVHDDGGGRYAMKASNLVLRLDQSSRELEIGFEPFHYFERSKPPDALIDIDTYRKFCMIVRAMIAKDQCGVPASLLVVALVPFASKEPALMLLVHVL